MALVNEDELARRLKLRQSLLGLPEVFLQELLFGCVLLVLGHLYGLPTSLLLVADHCLSAWGSTLVIFVNHCYHIGLRICLVEKICKLRVLHRVGLGVRLSKEHSRGIYVSKSNSLLGLYYIFLVRQVGGNHAIMLILSDPHGVLAHTLPRAWTQIIIRLEVLK